jgi:hypothetical protein
LIIENGYWLLYPAFFELPNSFSELAKVVCFDYKVSMTENPPEKEDLEKKAEKLSEEKEKKDKNDSRCEGRKTRSYYYDDASGYEIYDPDEDDTDED